MVPAAPVVELSMNPSTVVALKEFKVMVPALPVLEVLMILAVSAPPSVTAMLLLVDVSVIFPALPVEVFRIVPDTVTFSPAPLAVRLMLPPVPLEVELSMAKAVLPLLEIVTEPSAPVIETVPPVPVDVFITLPSMEMSSPAFTVITPPLPPVAELFMSPLFVPAASS